MSCYQLTSVLLVLTLVMYIQNSCSYLQRTRLTPTITTQTTTASVTGTAILIDRTNTKIHLTNRLLMSKVDNVQTPESVYLPAIPGNIMTLSRFMIEATRANPDHADFESLIASIQIACKSISNLLSRSGVSELIGGNSLTAVELSEIKSKDRGEVLYEAANTVLKNALRFTGKLGIIAAESEPHPLLIEEAWNSNYIAVFDPLDGSTNIDVGIVTGTIFGIFKESDECLMDFGEEIANEDRKACILKNLQPKNLVAAGYCMYSSSTVLMFSMGDGKLMVSINYTSAVVFYHFMDYYYLSIAVS